MKKTNTKKTSAAASDKLFHAIISLITVLLFFGTLVALGAVTAFSEKEDFSETQNKYLAKFPKLSGKNIYNGSFTSGVESFISDHFAGHDKWITAKSYLELASGKRERNDVYILRDRLVEKIPEPDMTVVNKSIEGIKKYAQDNKTVPFIMLVPTQAEIYKDMLPQNAPNPNQQEFINDVYKQLGESAVGIDVYSTLSANRNDYIYYRTDHHWTSEGAFLAYTAAGKRMGYTPLTEDKYDIEHAGIDFRGTFYSKVMYDGTEPDTLDIWLPTDSEYEPEIEVYETFGVDPEIHKGMYYREYLDVKDKYSTFFGTNKPMIIVRTGNEGGRLLIFKDSYAHCFVPFLTPHYSEITMVDLRYIQLSYKQLIDPSEYDQTLFLYNASTFMSDENIKKLMY